MCADRMKFICTRENLERAFSIAERFTGKNLTLPILGNMLLEVRENTLTVTATNLEYAVQLTVSGSGDKGGKVSIPAKIASALVQSMSGFAGSSRGDDKIQLEEKGGNVIMKSDTRDARLNGMPAQDFPLMPTMQKSASFEINSLELHNGLASVLPAVSLSEFKPELAGINCKVGLRTLHLAATDTFRLAEKTIPLARTGEPKQFSFILPQRMASELSRILDLPGQDGEEQISINLGDNQVLIEREGMRIISRLIEGNFPEYGAIIPNQFGTTCFLKRAELLQAVRSSSIFASKLQDVTFSFTKSECEISSSNQEIGEYHTRLPIALSGKEARVSFNYRYLMDGLTMLHGEEIFFGMNDETAPALMHDRTDNALLYVIMPIRVS
ncbi:MAG: DNA polymerase III subunit beta [Candidatus Sungbacteria bacterium]|nr:DNA polymerase III subunit beta [Candidatus Sungbacteria bacterium]